VEVVKDKGTGQSKGFAFVTMNAESDATKAISMFNAYSLSDHALKVNVAKPKAAFLTGLRVIESNNERPAPPHGGFSFSPAW